MAAQSNGLPAYPRAGVWRLIFVLLAVIAFLVAGIWALVAWAHPDTPKAEAVLLAFGLASFAAAHI